MMFQFHSNADIIHLVAAGDGNRNLHELLGLIGDLRRLHQP